MAEWFVPWTMELGTRVRSRLVAGLPTDYSMIGGNLQVMNTSILVYCSSFGLK